MNDKYQFTITGNDKTRKMFTSLKKNIGGVGRAMTGTTAKIGALVGAAGMGALVAKTLQNVDAMAKFSDRMNIATEDLSAFHHLAQLNGVSTNDFNKGLEKMVKGVGEASRGFGTAKKALDDLNISNKDLEGKTAAEQYQIIADKIAGLENQTQKASVANDIFGRSGVQLLNTIEQGAQGFTDAQAEVEKYGLAISRVDAAKIEEANDAMLRAQQAVSGVATKATVELAPIMTEVVNRFTAAATEGDTMGSAIETAFTTGASVVGVFADGIRGIKVLLKGAEIVGRGFGAALVGVFNFLINDVFISFGNSMRNAVFTPIREVLELAAPFSDMAQDALNKINELSSISRIEGLDNAFNGMVDGLRTAKTEMHDLMMEPLPSAVIKETIDSILTDAEERAAQTVANIQEKLATPGETITNDPKKDPVKKQDTENKAVEEKTKAHETKIMNIKATNSKKLAAIQAGIRTKNLIMEKASQLKIALGDGYVAVQKAWASAPFPANMPAVASTVLNTGMNVAAIGGLENGGPVGQRSIVEVGEKNKPEVLSWGGKNFLLGGNGGAVFNTSQLDRSGNSPQANIIVNLIEDASKSGQVEQNQGANGDTELSVFISDIRSHGERAQALENTYPQLKRQGSF